MDRREAAGSSRGMRIGGIEGPGANQAHEKTEREQRSTLSIPPRAQRSTVDARRARGFLRDTARRLERAASSRDSRDILAGLDLIRRAPAMIHGLEVRS
jgi:hypothetical protein